MNMTRRDKMLMLVVPALVIFIGYATYGLSHWRTKLTAAEKGIASTRAAIPGQAEEAKRRDKLAAATREMSGETEAMSLLKGEIAHGTKSLAVERQELAAAKGFASGPSHRDDMARIRTEHMTAVKGMETTHEQNRKTAERNHAAAVAVLWATSNGPAADRTERIELLNKVLARFDLTVVDAADDVKSDIAPPRLQPLMKAAAESKGLAPPKPRQIKVRGRYSEVAAALDSISRGEAWAVPLGLVMRTAADDAGRFEWTIVVWV